MDLRRRFPSGNSTHSSPAETREQRDWRFGLVSREVLSLVCIVFVLRKAREEVGSKLLVRGLETAAMSKERWHCKSFRIRHISLNEGWLKKVWALQQRVMVNPSIVGVSGRDGAAYFFPRVVRRACEVGVSDVI